MYKAVVFFDLDGTLLLDDKSLSTDTITAVRKLKQNNILPVIATGRNLFEVQYVLDQCGIDSIVSANGSYEEYEGKRVHAEFIPVPLIKRVRDFAAKYDDPVTCFNNKTCAINKNNDMTRENFKLLGFTPKLDPSWYESNPVNFLFVFNTDREEIYQKQFAGELSFVRNNPRGLDTMLAGVSKSSGIKHLLEAAGLTKVPTYGFGDQLNDLEMFGLVDHAVAMGNGHPKAKAAAEYVTTSNMAGGITHGLRHYGLID
ncbi:Cof-type HAD-IIB family hydrolase [Lacticaseibacillus zhaodongensis]|uniref:Cof-type HAD-IIB family hydrolase n=1 Tax=Lacticaseibacillus zhaodongensis TaxID=2668065 RepID=UPI0012D2A2E8|nr:Cof-type HAD-IIB family hydrolase [Lacticaseibacillus zhaodongensis]